MIGRAFQTFPVEASSSRAQVRCIGEAFSSSSGPSSFYDYIAKIIGLCSTYYEELSRTYGASRERLSGENKGIVFCFFASDVVYRRFRKNFERHWYQRIAHMIAHLSSSDLSYLTPLMAHSFASSGAKRLMLGASPLRAKFFSDSALPHLRHSEPAAINN
jgi:hypothetical protein